MNSDNQSVISDYLLKTLGIHNDPYTIKKAAFTISIHENSVFMDLITLSSMHQILIWTVSDQIIEDTLVRERLEFYLHATGAICGVICSESTKIQIINTPIRPGWRSEIIPVQEIISDTVIIEHPVFSEVLDQYLDTIWKTVSRVYFQSYGENEKKLRRLAILSAVLEILLRRIGGKITSDSDDILENSLFFYLVQFGSTIPYYSQQQVNTSVFDKEVRRKMIQSGLSLPIPQRLAIPCIDPILLVRGIHRLLSRIKTKENKKKIEKVSDCDPDSYLLSPVFSSIFHDIISRNPSIDAIFDPFSGRGEIVLLFARFLGLKCNELNKRLKNLSSAVYCSDNSISSILITRFGLALTIIGGDFSTPELVKPAHNESISQLIKHTRIGSCFFSPEVTDEFLSENEKRTAELTYRPLFTGWPDIPPKTSVLVITAPSGHVDLKIPEIRQFLCKKYNSYSTEPSFSTIAAENILLTIPYPAFIFIRRTWLSESTSEPFRRWVRKNRISKIVIDDSTKNPNDELWTCLIADSISPDIEIIRTNKNGKTKSFRIEKRELSLHGGWSLTDPSSSLILDLIRDDSIPLSEYCLGALYLHDEIKEFFEDDFWISCIAREDVLIIKSGNKPDPESAIIMKGTDNFLEGVLTSSVLQYYWKHTQDVGDGKNPPVAISLLPICRPDWYDEEEQTLVHEISNCMKKRSFLLQKLKYSQSYHDTLRIQKKITDLERNRDKMVSILYKIPENISLKYLIY
ncbi:hypothetical protein ACKUB1_05915 [Methanospirillum stamsii]|uniref:Uncharacterized protein n=1 Tax=Methanospirillum stamsii TaxID=1277351 RepID=A0A2V2N704_9EURY|nr:hypothetical protein [Methanospirillum stamsii]PWR71053.1 hypothetical protein DLD82_14200 [Methanospirillum stamsii]